GLGSWRLSGDGLRILRVARRRSPIRTPPIRTPPIRTPHSMSWLHGAWAVLLKDARLELRTRFALNALGLFVAASLFLLRCALGDAAVRPDAAAALVWIVIVFAATVRLGRAFVVEEQRGTVRQLQLSLRHSAVYLGKLLFNVGLTLELCAAGALLF